MAQLRKRIYISRFSPAARLFLKFFKKNFASVSPKTILGQRGYLAGDCHEAFLARLRTHPAVGAQSFTRTVLVPPEVEATTQQ
jgi:hypothetical protein